MLTMQSGTGVYYKAMPAVGPDGKNVMKLIPVEKVNGHFVPTHVLPTGNTSVPVQTSVPLPQNRFPFLQPIADGRFILKTPLEANTVFSSMKSQQRGPTALLQSSTNQVHVPVITHTVTPNTLTSPIQPNKALIITNSTQLPNTVKPPVVPSGHYLQIPSNATVKTLPASDLPVSIKNRICHTANTNSSVTTLPMVLYVSPVSSLKLDQQAPCLTKLTELPQTQKHASTSSVVKSPEESPKNKQVNSTPMKWVVEERAGSRAQYLIPVASSSMSTDILKAVRDIESSKVIKNQAATEPVSTDINREMVTPGNDNALVMCDGKVYFVATRNNEVSKDMVSNAETKLPPTKTAQTLTTALPTVTVASNVSQKQDPKSPGDNKMPSDVIDLCDDEDETSACPSSGWVNIRRDEASEHDEDSNVIFVSYIPPKSSEAANIEEVTETPSLISCVKDTEHTNLDTERVETDSVPKSTRSAEVDASKCEAVLVNEPALEGSEVLSENLEVASDQHTEAIEKTFEEKVPDQLHQPKSDSELRRTFGITSDLRVSLKKIDESKEEHEDHQQNKTWLINKRTVDGIRKLIHDSNIETKITQLFQTQVPKPVKTGKRRRFEGRNEEKNGAYSSALSNDLVDCEYESQSASSERSKDKRDLQTCRAAEEETSYTCGPHEVLNATASLCSSSVLKPVQSHTAKCQSDSPACCSALRKIPPRSSKGSGRVCTACPCGTKVGALAGNSASKAQEKLNSSSSINSSKSESNRNVTPVHKALEDSASGSTDCNSASGKSTDKTIHGSQIDVNKDVKGTAKFSTNHPEGHPATTGAHSSNSVCKQEETCDKATSSQLETAILKPAQVSEVKKNSVQRLSYTSYTIPSELYSSVVLDPEEIKRQERIKRLKDILQEKEAALEKLRKSL